MGNQIHKKKECSLTLAHLYGTPLQECLNLWKMKHLFGKERIASNSQKLSIFFRHVHKFKIQDKYRITIPQASGYSKKTICSYVTNRLSSAGIHAYIIAFIVKRLSIVVKYAPSIKDIINSSNKATEAFHEDHPPACSCHLISSFGTDYGSALGHLWIKGT